MTETKTKTYKLNTGKVRCALDAGVELEITMRRLSLPEKLRYQPLMGRAGEDLGRWSDSLQPYAAHEELVATLGEGEPAPPAPTSPLHDMDPVLWESVADAVSSVVAIATIYQDGETYEVPPRDRHDLIAQLGAADLVTALAAAVRSQDLTAAEKNG